MIGCAKQEVKNIGSQGKNIVCFGDSLTAGYGVRQGEDYPTALAKILKKRVINKGIDGNTTVDGLSRLEADVLEQEPYLVIIEFGGNDYLNKIPAEDTANNLRKMIDRIHAQGVMVALVDISAGVFLNEYHTICSKIAREKQTIFVPRILLGIITNPSMKSDFLHPNHEGYKVIAKRIYDAIIPYLKQNAELRNQK